MLHFVQFAVSALAASATLHPASAQVPLQPPPRLAGPAWHPTGPLPGAGPSFSRFAETAADPGRIYAATSAGVVISEDGGASWQLRSRYERAAWSSAAIAVSQVDPDCLLLAPLGDGVLRSTDGGVSWTRPALPPPDPWLWSPILPSGCGGTCFVTGADGVYRSTDGGETFEPVLEGLQALGGYAWETLIDLQDSQHLYCNVVDLGIFESEDGGTTWLPKGFPPSTTWPTLALDPQDGERLIAGYGGTTLWLSENGGDTWTSIGAGLPAQILDALAIDPLEPDRMYAALRCGGIARSSDGGLTWALLADAGLDHAGAMATAILPSRTDAGLLLVGDAGGAFRSLDRGDHFARANDGLAAAALVMDLVVDPLDAQHWIAKSGGSAFSSFDGGATWTEAASGPGFYGERLDVDRVLPGRLYVGGFDDRVWRSDDGGLSFDPVGQVNWSLHITAHPTLAGRLYASGSGLKVSNDGGLTFANAGIPAMFTPAFGISPADSSVMYCAGEGVLYRTESGGAHWELSDEPPPAYVRDIACDPLDPDRAWAAVPWVGLYRTEDRGRTWHAMNTDLVEADTAVLLSALPGAALQAHSVGGGVLLTNSRSTADGLLSFDGAESSRFLSRGLETPILQFAAGPGVLIAGTSGSGVVSLR
jgi:photosystem II stability/assembly factor-like uncharacterized protein